MSQRLLMARGSESQRIGICWALSKGVEMLPQVLPAMIKTLPAAMQAIRRPPPPFPPPNNDHGVLGVPSDHDDDVIMDIIIILRRTAESERGLSPR